MQDMKIGIMGAGNISKTYFELSPLFKGISVTAVADLSAEAAKAAADKYGVKAMTPDEMCTSDDVDIIVNLTIPAAHFEVTKKALEGGKHVYSEKPFVLSLDEGQAIADLAKSKGLRVGSAPDTFLGGAHQQARSILDAGDIGRVHSATAHVMSPGMEHWHPNPDFFFLPGGGPILDLGPYYLANLVNLLGPVAKVTALTGKGHEERTITSQPRNGENIPVKVDTTIHALLQFESGAMVTLGASWDVHGHRHGHMELYGTEGTLLLPDPNFFGGKVEMAKRGQALSEVTAWAHPFGVPNQIHGDQALANYRAAGLADMARAIQNNDDFACDQMRALHVIDIMTSILKAGETGEWLTLTTSCTRPAPMGPDEARALLN